MTDLLVAGCCAAVAAATAVSYEPLRVWAGAPRPSPMFRRTADRFETARKIVIATALLIAAALSAAVGARWPVDPGYLAAAALVAAAAACCLLKPALDWIRQLPRVADGVPVPAELSPARIAAEHWYRVFKFQQSYTTGWSGTVGQVFSRCRTAAEFEGAERPGDGRSFDRLARARQNFPIGPHYVYSAVTAARAAWDLPVQP